MGEIVSVIVQVAFVVACVGEAALAASALRAFYYWRRGSAQHGDKVKVLLIMLVGPAAWIASQASGAGPSVVGRVLFVIAVASLSLGIYLHRRLPQQLRR